MNAPELLATVRARGATAHAEMDATGAAVLVVAPRAAIGDLLPDLLRFKPQLIELLSVSTKTFIGGHREEETGQISPLASSVDRVSQINASGPSRPILAFPDADELERFAGVQLTARHLAAWTRLQTERPQLVHGDLLDVFAAGLQPDDGGGAAVWREPVAMADELQIEIVDWCQKRRRI